MAQNFNSLVVNLSTHAFLSAGAAAVPGVIITMPTFKDQLYLPVIPAFWSIREASGGYLIVLQQNPSFCLDIHAPSADEVTNGTMLGLSSVDGASSFLNSNLWSVGGSTSLNNNLIESIGAYGYVLDSQLNPGGQVWKNDITRQEYQQWTTIQIQ